MLNDLLQKITPSTVVVTPNQRLASFISQQYLQFQQHTHNSNVNSSNLTSNLLPPILPLNNWLMQYWQQCHEKNLLQNMTLLSDAQTHTLWEEIILQSDQGTSLLNTTATANLAYAAWELMQNWQINLNNSTFQLNEDTKTWSQWAKRFSEICQKNAWIDQNQIMSVLIAQINTQQFNLPAQIIWVGFTELTPLHKSFIKMLAKNGCHIFQQQLSTQNRQCHRIALTDTETELRTMALWAKKCLDENENTQIACVIPELNQLRQQTIRIFTEILAPKSLLSVSQNSTLPFNISSGRQLNDYPIIHNALAILSIRHTYLSMTEISTLLRSPFLEGAEKEMSARALCDAKLRDIQQHSLSFKTVISAALQTNCAIFANQLQAFDKLPHQAGQPQKTDYWGKYFMQQLNALGWPGDRVLNSSEYQLMQQWQELIVEFSNLHNFLPPITHQSALSKLKNMAALRTYQIQSPQARVHILEIIEASGTLFDHLWIMGLHDLAWPATTQANPFIPLQLQRSLKMPHISTEQEWQFSDKLTQQFKRSANTVIFSHPLKKEDRKLRASTLIADIPEKSIAELNLPEYQSITQLIFASQKLEELIEDPAPPLTTSEKIQGGSALLKYQAACPFRAFAQYRLGATPLAEPVSGLPAIERGKLVHRVLEKFWQTVKSHTQLCSYDNDELNKIIHTLVSGTLQEIQFKFGHTLQKRYLSIEQQRLILLLNRWLKWEKLRKPFTVIATEEKINFCLGQINLKLQADRIDKLDENQYVIIDYKTSNTTVQDWYGDRPDEPQLPLYCIATAIPVSSLAFAQIKSDDLNCKEIGEQGLTEFTRTTNILNSDEWQQLKQHWQIVLTNLSEEIWQGVAIVNPKHGTQTCQFCHLSSLCRIRDLTN